MKAFPLALLALIGLTATAQAHEIWVERDGAGPARIYLGEPGDTLPEGGDPEFEKLKSPKLVPATQAAVTWLSAAAHPAVTKAYSHPISSAMRRPTASINSAILT